MNKREFKDTVYTELAKVVKAMANPIRLEIIDLLAQGPFSVEQIATNTGQSVANTSQHLQTLKNAKLVKISREGNFIHYSLTDENVFKAWSSLRELGFAYNAEIEKVIQDFRSGHNSGMDAVDAETLQEMLKNDEIVLLDVRPEEEYNRGHIHKAISTPIEKLEIYLKSLSKKKMVVAYCRGPLCVYADEAVALLKDKGYNAKRMDDGFPEWMLKGYQVEFSK
ncbi:MAG: ArsR family transcriptional regulator [Candidatus Fluviicola riflensis]|nr:MAG: ArsR family transcriptional regulator [Candidatus Fluviicola riflensis]OGS77811.1 MAG: ArsR family transcriptional regulator [Candidatus Fluviicola riflensis]OGS84876.1 MAG: ArsR family transcriptional regulator [Fluviicola sp. RIFCSPHIGHO2_01_FULL_43_53]OGS89148.1 MAG: ArsR family transcriptional regulator [Fluviicola sp. RIFCSPHIGHO2_12_FULL_43_24]